MNIVRFNESHPQPDWVEYNLSQLYLVRLMSSPDVWHIIQFNTKPSRFDIVAGPFENYEIAEVAYKLLT